MDNTTQIEDLENHINALRSSYDNLIEILNQPLERGEDDTIKLKDAQKKAFAEGVQKSSDAADDLFAKIKSKKLELEELKNPTKASKQKKKEENENQSDLSRRIKS